MSAGHERGYSGGRTAPRGRRKVKEAAEALRKDMSMSCEAEIEAAVERINRGLAGEIRCFTGDDCRNRRREGRVKAREVQPQMSALVL